MLTEKQMHEIRAHLEKAQNPLFYYDNDSDGLCSFVILRRFIGRGKGVAIRSFPGLNGSYAKKVYELNSDYVFVLDKPIIAKEFIEEISKLNLPLVWIDHHDLNPEKFEKDFNNLYVYNPARNKGKNKSYEPTTYLSYKLTNRKEDVWLAFIGCIADHYLPDFIKEFAEHYPEFVGNKKNISNPFEIYYETEIGRVAMMLNFGLKDSVTHVVKLQNFLISSNSPNDVLVESYSNYSFRKKYNEVKNKYDALIEKAKKEIKGNLIFFDYGGELSISSDISNELSYRYPDKYVVVAYKKGATSNLSLRGKNVKKILDKVLKEVDGNGGGHEDAVGARIKTEDLNKFKEILEKEISILSKK